VAYYLASLGWSQGAIGLALTVDNLMAVLGQVPGGALAETTRGTNAPSRRCDHRDCDCLTGAGAGAQPLADLRRARAA
jgi:hypothetical protein